MNNLIEYLESNFISFTELSSTKIEIDNKVYSIVEPDEDDNVIFDEDFRLIADEDIECDRFCYNFGGNWYFEEKKDINKPKLNELKYLGVADLVIPTETFLGVHGGYELLNGSRVYKDWIKKAKFIGCKSLGICEKNTLAGTMKFQLECKKAEIKSILGATYTVFRKEEDFRYDITLFAKNENGWRNLLLINKEVKVINKNFVEEQSLFSLLQDLFVIADPKSLQFEKINKGLLNVIDFYNFDTVNYELESQNDTYFNNLVKYFKSNIPPICVSDAYYLEKEDSRIKKKLNQISGVFDLVASNQFFKTKQEYYDELSNFFDESDIRLDKLFSECLKNEKQVTKHCNFSIDTSQRHLPKYEMTKEQKLKYKTNENMFLSLIEEGFILKCPKGKEEEYRARIATEIEVIGLVNGSNGSSGLDYFLILWDIIRYCDENDILHGHSRGSSAGSLVAYLLNITQIDSIKWDLLFERFLNSGRAAGKKIEQEKIIVSLENGEVREYWIDEKIKITREGKEKLISITDLKKTDELL